MYYYLCTYNVLRKRITVYTSQQTQPIVVNRKRTIVFRNS